MKKRNLQATVVRLLPFIISLGLVLTMICYINPYVRYLTLYGKTIALYDATGNTKVIRQKIKTFLTLQTFHTSMPNSLELNQTDKQQKCTGCFSESIHLIIDNKEICKPSNKYIDILIMITSSPQNKLSRNAMRDTWLRHTKNNTGNIRYVFLLGEPPRTKELEKENFQTKDIILGSFKNAYNNLTFKTLMGFQWANKQCTNAQFVMKTDDDVYVHIPGLKKALKENANALQNAVGGRCQHIASPVRDKRSKWYVSFDSYPEKTYPGYCSGTGYVTSLNVITKIVKISKSVPFFNLDDVFVALCIKQLGLRLNPITGFMLAYDFVNCKNNDNTLVTIHQVSVSILRRIWEIPCNANKV